MLRRPPRSTLPSSSAASDVYKRQASMRDHGVRLGRPFTLGLTATRPHGETVDIDRLGFGLYEQVVPTVRAGGVAFQTLHGDGDAQERIVRHATVPVARARVLRLSVPASDEPRSIAYGWE